MWDMILTITKHRQHYTKMTLQREHDAAVEQARDIAQRFPESEGFKVVLYRWANSGEPIDFSDIDKARP